jgi:drug/metabolite transporter (DMT)-like permease
MIWIFVALLAGTFQAFRNFISRELSRKITPLEILWARFTFALPLTILCYLGVILKYSSLHYSLQFLFLTFIAGVTQLSGGLLLVHALKIGNFAQTIALGKLESVFIAFSGALFFSEFPAMTGWIGVGFATIGVFLINLGREGAFLKWRNGFRFDRAGILAILAAAITVLSSFSPKYAVAELLALNPSVTTSKIVTTIHVMFFVFLIETILLTLALFWKGTSFRELFKKDGKSLILLGTVSAVTTFFWFWAFSLTLVAYVSGIAQVESIIALILSRFKFNEQAVGRIVPGIVVLTLGVLLLILS